jgi:hypothetical protein
MTTRAIPTTIQGLITFSARALAGVQNLGVTLDIAQNTAARIQTDRFDLVGESGSMTNPGKQAALNSKRSALTVARAARQIARAAGRKFCAIGVDLLKPQLGRRWNPAWLAAGFSRFSISTGQGNPLPMLIEFRNYLRDNPARANIAEGFTEPNADARIAAIESTEHGVNAAISARKLAAQERDAAVKKLRRRMTALREELALILSDTDARWLEFGFSRPADSQAPEPVSGLTATPGQPGTVIVQHAASARALDYRVTWKPQFASGDPTVVGLFADLAVTLSGLPSGTTIVVNVTARNNAGETQPASVTVLVP